MPDKDFSWATFDFGTDKAPIPATKERLYSVALNLIWQSNYVAVGVNEICKKAGVTKGSFYHHFQSKADLFSDATLYYLESASSKLDSVLSPLNPPLEQLEDIIDFILKNKFGKDADNCPGCPFLSAGTQCEDDQRVLEALRTMSLTAIRYNLALAQGLQREGLLEEGVDPERSARYIHQYLQGALIYAKLHRDPELVYDDVPEAFYRLLGLKKEYWHSRGKRSRRDEAAHSEKE